MKIAGADNMREVILSHLNTANWPFALEGSKVSSINEAGDQLVMLRSPELIAVLQNGNSDVIFCGDDILKERELQFRSLGQDAPNVREIARFEKYGRKMVQPTLDLVMPQVKAKDGTGWIEPGHIIVTEHPYITRDFLESRSLRTVEIGSRPEIPLLPRYFKKWAEEEGVVGILVIKGKAPGLLELGYGDAAILVNETGRTVKENDLYVAATIRKIRTLLIASRIGPKTEGNRIEKLARNLEEAYLLMSTRELESTGPNPERL